MINDEIIRITDRIIDTVAPEKVYLFGSYAYGTPTPESDYDFYVVIPNESMKPMDAICAIRASLRPERLMKSIDVLAADASEFDFCLGGATMERKIAREGVLLFDRVCGKMVEEST